jgi:hypothetical protein
MLEVGVLPPEPDRFAAPKSGRRDHRAQRAQRVTVDVVQEFAQLGGFEWVNLRPFGAWQIDVACGVVSDQPPADRGLQRRPQSGADSVHGCGFDLPVVLQVAEQPLHMTATPSTIDTASPTRTSTLRPSLVLARVGRAGSTGLEATSGPRGSREALSQACLALAASAGVR